MSESKKFFVSNGEKNYDRIITLYGKSNFLDAACEWGRLTEKSSIVQIYEYDTCEIWNASASYDIVGCAKTNNLEPTLKIEDVPQ